MYHIGAGGHVTVAQKRKENAMSMARRFTLPACLYALVLAGCAQERPVIVETSRGMDPEVHNPAGNAMEAIKAYGFEQRDLAVNNLESVIADLDRRIRDFRGRSKSIASDRREDWNEEVTKLELKRDELEVNATRIKFATADRWDDAKDSAIDSLEEVQDLLEELQEIVQD
jgi:hypothetical protein